MEAFREFGRGVEGAAPYDAYGIRAGERSSPLRLVEIRVAGARYAPYEA